MKFSEDIIKGFNLEPLEEKEPVNVMQVEDMLQFMKSCAERIVQKSEQYINTDDVDNTASAEANMDYGKLQPGSIGCI